MRTLQLLALFSICAGLQAQTPDVTQSSSFTALGSGTPVFVGTGGPNGVQAWRITYFVDGSSFTAAQMAIQGADATNAAGCATASYTTITTAGSSVVESANPSASAAQGNVGVKAYYPCIRATLTAVTGSGGTVFYQLAGWKYLFAVPQTIVPSGTQNVNVAQVAGTNTVQGGVSGSLGVGGLAADGATAAGNPVLIGGHDAAGTPLAHIIQTDANGDLITAGAQAPLADGSTNTPVVPAVGFTGTSQAATNRSYQYTFNGSTWDRNFVCTNQAAFNLSGSGDTQIIALSGSTVIRLCHISFTTTAPEDIKVTQGTGSNCGTSNADVTGLYKQVTGLALDFTPAAALRSSAGFALCLNQSAVQALGGIAVYARY